MNPCTCDDTNQTCPACVGTGDYWDRALNDWGTGKCLKCNGSGEKRCPVHRHSLKEGDQFIENWSGTAVTVTGVTHNQVTTLSSVGGQHKVYPHNMFWQLHARP